MGLLTDAEIKDLLSNGQLLENLSPGYSATAVRGCSADLHVGKIFRPKVFGESRELTVGSPYTRLSLAEGETAVIETREKFKLTSKYSAVVLPTSSVSMRGLLMTNPGHVDPGYIGSVHVTVINMGRRPFELREGDRFLRTLLFELDGKVDTPFKSPTQPTSPINDELLITLAPDFLSVKERASAAAAQQVSAAGVRAQIMQFVIPSAFALLGVIVGNLSATRDFDRRIHELEEVKADFRVRKLEYDYPTAQQLADMKKRIEELESRPNSSSK